ncbi:MAG: hypothetical protein M1817_004338 [Caeruleum heppii]|nr:MAG: hypothetical protein M1817_004338 [Caeruleum heppii]
MRHLTLLVSLSIIGRAVSLTPLPDGITEDMLRAALEQSPVRVPDPYAQADTDQLPAFKLPPSVTCSDRQYDYSSVSTALEVGYSVYNEGLTPFPNSNSAYSDTRYPEQFAPVDRTNIINTDGGGCTEMSLFPLRPITDSAGTGVWTGQGDPGADRVAFDKNGLYCGAFIDKGNEVYDPCLSEAMEALEGVPDE